MSTHSLTILSNTSGCNFFWIISSLLTEPPLPLLLELCFVFLCLVSPRWVLQTLEHSSHQKLASGDSSITSAAKCVCSVCVYLCVCGCVWVWGGGGLCVYVCVCVCGGGVTNLKTAREKFIGINTFWHNTNFRWEKISRFSRMFVFRVDVLSNHYVHMQFIARYIFRP